MDMKKNKGLLFGTVLALTLLGAAPAYASLAEGQNVTWDLDGTIESNDGSSCSLVKNEDGSWTVTMCEPSEVLLGFTSSIPYNNLDWSIVSTDGYRLSNKVSMRTDSIKKKLSLDSQQGDGGWDTTVVAYPVNVIQMGQPRWDDTDYLNIHRGNEITIHVKTVMSETGLWGNGKDKKDMDGTPWWWADASKRFQVYIPREEFTKRFNRALMYYASGERVTFFGNSVANGQFEGQEVQPVTYSAELEQIARQRAEELLKEYKHTDAGFGKEYYEYSWFVGGRFDASNNNGIEVGTSNGIPMFGGIEGTLGFNSFDSQNILQTKHILMQDHYRGIPFSKPITEIGAARVQVGECYGIDVLLTR